MTTAEYGDRYTLIGPLNKASVGARTSEMYCTYVMAADFLLGCCGSGRVDPVEPTPGRDDRVYEGTGNQCCLRTMVD